MPPVLSFSLSIFAHRPTSPELRHCSAFVPLLALPPSVLLLRGEWLVRVCRPTHSLPCAAWVLAPRSAVSPFAGKLTATGHGAPPRLAPP